MNVIVELFLGFDNVSRFWKWNFKNAVPGLLTLPVVFDNVVTRDNYEAGKITNPPG